jgi:hypothetical protein
MRINKIIFSLLCCGLVALWACTGNYENINSDPYAVGEEEYGRDGYNISGRLMAMQQAVISIDVNRTHQTDILLGGAWGRYASESKENSWPMKFSTFNPEDGWSCVMFNEIIPYIYPPYNKLRSVTSNPVVFAISDIIKVIAMNRVTDTYGPIPYSKIGADGAVQAPYDSQRDVYMKMFDELDAAIATLTEHQTESITPKADNIYKGDLVKWIRLANSMKLRLAMRVVYAEPVIAQQKAEEAISDPIGVMSGNTDNAALTSFGADGNPINIAVKYNAGDNRSSADITTYMNAYADPRLAAYFEVSGFLGGGFHGFRCGLTLGGLAQFQNYSIFKIDRNTPLQWMNAAEVMFLRAEGALRGWNMGGTAQEFYEKGVTTSFEQWGVSGATAYLANSTGSPSGYTDPAGAYSYSSPLTTVTVKWDTADESNFELSLELIIIQKWLANFMIGHEAWADRRRTGYPTMIPVVVNGSSGLLANDGVPRRCPYPISETITNGANYAKGVEMLGGGADNIATRLWWDCK